MRPRYLILISMCFGLSCRAQSIGDLDVQRQSVAVVRSHPDDRAEEDAAAIFVGENSQNAFFVTALHALERTQGSGNLVQKVQLRTFDNPVWVTASVFDHLDGTDDLAVVYIPASNLSKATIALPCKTPSPELPIHILGHPAAGAWTSWTGIVQNENKVGMNTDMFSSQVDRSLAKGYSGGAVLDSQGHLIGMHLSATTTYGKNLKCSAIMNRLRSWDISFNSVAAVDPDLVKLVSEFDNRLSEVEGYKNHVVDPKTTVAERKTLGVLIWRVWYGDHEYHPVAPEFNGHRWVEIVTQLKFHGITERAAEAERAIHDIEQAEADDPNYPNLLATRVASLKAYSNQVLHPAIHDTNQIN